MVVVFSSDLCSRSVLDGFSMQKFGFWEMGFFCTELRDDETMSSFSVADFSFNLLSFIIIIFSL